MHGIARAARADLLAVADGVRPRVSAATYSIAEGLPSTECSSGGQPSAWKGRDGRLWFTTTRGVVVFDPRRMRENRVPPPVHVERRVADGQPLAADGRAQPGRGDLEFEYGALSLVNPAKVQFRYRLKGFDAACHEAGSRRVAYYTNVPPGRYRFRVIASNNDGVWNEEGATVNVELAPHFHQTRAFLALCVLGIAGVLVAGHHLRVRRLRSSERRLASLVDARTAELAAANEALGRLAVTDALTGLPNRRRALEFLDQQWRQAARAGQPMSVLMIDVDAFKAYNDSLGHQAGDECLRRVARARTRWRERAI
jgi:hypothetical protein